MDPTAVLSQVKHELDFFLCTAVYQHFPDKAYGEEVTRLASGMLRPGGLALIQARYDDGSRKMRAKSRVTRLP